MDVLLVVVGAVSAAGVGATFPLFTLFWGDATDAFASALPGEEVKQVMFNMLQLGLASFLVGWLMMAVWTITGERQGIRCRVEYLSAILGQEISWFDSSEEGSLATKLSD
jgi:ATP-binding cassette subfamily B (MDR/TAP) protein 1